MKGTLQLLPFYQGDFWRTSPQMSQHFVLYLHISQGEKKMCWEVICLLKFLKCFPLVLNNHITQISTWAPPHFFHYECFILEYSITGIAPSSAHIHWNISRFKALKSLSLSQALKVCIFMGKWAPKLNLLLCFDSETLCTFIGPSASEDAIPGAPKH